jgi:hypothetical protein
MKMPYFTQNQDVKKSKLLLLVENLPPPTFFAHASYKKPTVSPFSKVTFAYSFTPSCLFYLH